MGFYAYIHMYNAVHVLIWNGVQRRRECHDVFLCSVAHDSVSLVCYQYMSLINMYNVVSFKCM